MTHNDPNRQAETAETQQPQTPETPETPTKDAKDASSGAETSGRILIGSQRDVAAASARQRRDWQPVDDTESNADPGPPAKTKPSPDTATEQTLPGESAVAPPLQEGAAAKEPAGDSLTTEKLATKKLAAEESGAGEANAVKAGVREIPADATTVGRFPPPNLRDKLTPDLEDEFEEALGGASLDAMMGDMSQTNQEMFEEESRHTGRVVAVRRGDIFIDLGSREQGCLSVKLFEEELPEVGAAIEVIVQRFNMEDGLYDLRLPGSASKVDDWADVSDGMIVDARITGHNTGGLECEVGHLRGFIPVSQISLYRVEDLAQFVGEKLLCLVTEANPQRRNLVLSRRAVLEREREEAREKLLASLAPGQVHEGIVRKMLDFGAFVDLGGVDGLIHISQLSWERIAHPSEVLSEGQTIQVKIEKVDPQTGRIGLAYRDLLQNPWDDVNTNYAPHSVVTGKVTRLADFGAFVQLEPGIEGLVHISELSHKRVHRASDVVKEGEEVSVMILSVDRSAQRISLSIKQTVSNPAAKSAKEGEAEIDVMPLKSRKYQPSKKPLVGGMDGTSGGEKCGLNW